MQFNPKFSFWLGVVVTAMIGIAGGTVHLTNAIPADWIPAVTAWASLLAFFGSGLLTAMHGLSSPQSGPLVSQPGLPPVPRAPIIILVIAGAALLALLLPGTASAQAPRLTGNPVRDFAPQTSNATRQSELDLVGKLGQLSLPDFQYALALATATKNVVSIPCWQAWVDLLTAQQKGVVGPDGVVLVEPDPHLITNIERMSELLANLRPDSPISTSCAALAGAAGKDAATLIGGILSGGALGLFKLPVIP
jgi:hypothetical protein